MESLLPRSMAPKEQVRREHIIQNIDNKQLIFHPFDHVVRDCVEDSLSFEEQCSGSSGFVKGSGQGLLWARWSGGFGEGGMNPLIQNIKSQNPPMSVFGEHAAFGTDTHKPDEPDARGHI